jgi:threonine dehydratase
MKYIPSFEDIQTAHIRIKKYIHRTPVFTSASINKICGAELFFKCENFQKTGSFKYRGATNAVRSLSDKEAFSGVATHSSGNFAAALALAAKTRGIKCFAVMPENSSSVKIQAVKGYGADITFCKPDLKSRETTLESLIKENGAKFIHSYNYFDVICGQGTAAKELIEDIPYLEYILAPVGGGGMISGTSIASKALNPEIKVFGAEPKNADDAYRSFKSGKLVPSENPQTIADGLLTSLGDLTFEIIRKKTDDIYTVSEESIIEATKTVWERMKIIIEPSSAVPLAAVMANKQKFRNRKTGIILTGGNIDLKKILKIIY